MPEEYLIRPGGLMRCCIATLQEHAVFAKVPPKEGDLLPCKYHPQDDGMIFRDGCWEWNKKEE